MFTAKGKGQWEDGAEDGGGEAGEGGWPWTGESPPARMGRPLAATADLGILKGADGKAGSEEKTAVQRIKGEPPQRLRWSRHLCRVPGLPQSPAWPRQGGCSPDLGQASAGPLEVAEVLGTGKRSKSRVWP